jgi:hypothetical protein
LSTNSCDGINLAKRDPSVGRDVKTKEEKEEDCGQDGKKATHFSAPHGQTEHKSSEGRDEPVVWVEQ